MSVKFSRTTSDYLEWNELLNLIQKLNRDKDYVFALIMCTGSYFGLRISDLRMLKWSQILENQFTITEQKTKKERTIIVNQHAQSIIAECYKNLGCPLPTQHCFLSKRGTVLSIQRINAKFKEIKTKYHLHIDNFSTHSLRKIFGRKVYQATGGDELSLIKLSLLFNHSSTQITRRYLGLRKEEILNIYKIIDD